jgi:hypothetical protein
LHWWENQLKAHKGNEHDLMNRFMTQWILTVTLHDTVNCTTTRAGCQYRSIREDHSSDDILTYLQTFTSYQVVPVNTQNCCILQWLILSNRVINHFIGWAGRHQTDYYVLSNLTMSFLVFVCQMILICIMSWRIWKYYQGNSIISQSQHLWISPVLSIINITSVILLPALSCYLSSSSKHALPIKLRGI